MTQLFDFGTALDHLRNGAKVRRDGWGKGLWLELQQPDAHSKMTLPYLYINYPDDARTTPGARVPWLASQTDMLACDWIEVCDSIAGSPADAWLAPDMSRFTSAPGSGIVADPLTGLEWAQEELEELDWDASTQACRDYRGGGHTDWRMPTRAELLTIVDLERHSPCLPSIFNTAGEYVWTATQTAWRKDKAGSSRSFFVVGLDNGGVYYDYADNRLRVRPVRRAVPASQ